MILSSKGWKNVFLFCLGLFLGTTFCMKWLETGFFCKGELFTIIGLEISYSADRIMDILHQLEEPVITRLEMHLYVDFVFMAGAYGGIASLLMMACYRVTGRRLRQLLQLLAILQLVAWGCDIRENGYLLDWLNNKPDIRSSMTAYHLVVLVKWTLALLGILLALPFVFRKTIQD